MTNINNIRLKNKISLLEKGFLFFHILIGIMHKRREGLSRNEIKQLPNFGPSTETPEKYAGAISKITDKYWELDQYDGPDSGEHWQQHWPAFQGFLQQIGLSLDVFDRALIKSLPDERDREDFQRFLVCYFLLIVDKTSPGMINEVFQTVLDNCWDLFVDESQRLTQELFRAVSGLSFIKTDSLMEKDVGIFKSTLLPFLISYAYNTKGKAQGILLLPYQYLEVEPEDFVAYLFKFQSRDLPTLHRILNALLDVAMGARTLPENKPLLKPAN